MAQGKKRRGARSWTTRMKKNLKLDSELCPMSSGYRRLQMETLEDRRLLATYVVNNLGDLDQDGNVVVGSLRQAIQLSNASTNDTDTIVFEDYLGTGTISLDGRPNGGTLVITDEVNILGPGPHLTIQGVTGQRVFDINGIGADNQFRPVTIGGMTISGGVLFLGDGRGAGIQNQEALTLDNVIVTGNSAGDGGGGIYQPFGSLTIQNSLVWQNSSGGGGGGVYNGEEDGDLPADTNLINSTVSGNNTFSIEDHPGFGGGVFNRRGYVSIQNSTISENTASVRGGGVATYGVEDPTMDGPIVTSIDYTIASGNFAGGDPDDVAGIFVNVDGDPIVPTLNILTYNIITVIGGAEYSDPNDPMVGGNGNFYLVVSAPDGIDWDTANLFSGGGSSHLATITSAEENDFVFSLIDDPLYWVTYAPDDPMADPPPAPAQSIGPWIGGIQVDEEGDADEGWQWVAPDDGLTFDDFVAWDAGQPDDGATDNADDLPAENRLAFHSSSDMERTATWADMVNDPEDDFKPIAYVIEFDQGDTNQFGVDPVLRPLDTYGGSMPVYYPNSTIDPENPFFDEDFTVISPAIDAGDPMLFLDGSDARGLHFSRVDPDNQIIDIGATEVQRGFFAVDALEDETDGQYSRVWDTTPEPDLTPLPEGQNVITFDYSTPGDFSFREALQFSRDNPEVDTITFSSALNDASQNTDPTASTANTILLTLGSLSLDHLVHIQGPSFELEIDAEGSDATPTIDNGDGTPVFFASGTVDVSNLILRGGDTQEEAGSIYTFGDLTLRNVTIRDNTTPGRGGAIYVAGGNTYIESSTIYNNKASLDGGAIYNAGGTVTILNSTVSGNSAELRGGGIVTRGGDTYISHSTITLNHAAVGGGVVNFRDVLGSTTIYSTIIVGNTGNDVQHVLAGDDNIISSGYNLVGTGNAVTGSVFSAAGDQTGVTSAQVKLAPLVKLGGPTPVHRLEVGSIAIDAGDPAAVAGDGDVPLYDQRGFPFGRVVDGGSGPIIDVGAYEVHLNDLFVGDGSAAEGSYSSFEAALNDANLNTVDERIIFLETSSGIVSGSFDISDSLEIIGLGTGQTSFSSGGFTITDGDDENLIDVKINGARFSANFHVESSENLAFDEMLFVGNAFAGNGGAIAQQGALLTIDDSTFIGNAANAGGSGGAIHVLDGDLVINNTFLSGNSSGFGGGDGGAIYLRGGDFTADYLYLSGNKSASATGDGGALYLRDATVNITNAVISGNFTVGSNAEGGAIFAKDSDVSIGGASYLSSNKTSGSESPGGAILTSGGSLAIEDATFFQNGTNGMLSSGGAIAALDADVTISTTLIDDHTVAGANSHGGAIYSVGGNLTITDSSIVNNTASGTGSNGGGIHSGGSLVDEDTTMIVNSTVSGNTATNNGGGIYNAGGLTEIRHATITNNASSPYLGFGNGVGSHGDAETTLTSVYHSIIAGNGVSDVDRIAGDFADTFESQGYNLIGFGITGAFNASTHDQVGILDPMLEPLSANGTHAIMVDSPAINGGDPSAVAGSNGIPEFDQLGADRVKNGVIDIGAIESDLLPKLEALEGDYNGDGVVNGKDFLAWQRGESPSPLSSTDLSNWQVAYGTSSELATMETMLALDQKISAAISAALASDVRIITASVSAEEVESPRAESAAAEVSEDSPWWVTADDTSESHQQLMEEYPVESTETTALEPDSLELLAVDRHRAAPSLGRGEFRSAENSEQSAEEVLAEDLVFDWIGSTDF